MARRSRRSPGGSKAAFRFEAAVMGGTPVLRLLAEDLAGTRVLSLRGIVNGTTNYILTEMAANGSSYAEALAAAQAAGYAEADPTADVEGGDAADKLVILARLAFGDWLDRASVSTGSRGPARDHRRHRRTTCAAAAARGEAIRLLASASQRDRQRPDRRRRGSGCGADRVGPGVDRRRAQSTGDRDRSARLDRRRRARARAAPPPRRRCSRTLPRSPRVGGSRPGARLPPRAPAGGRRRVTSDGAPARSSSATGNSCRSPTRRRR